MLALYRQLAAARTEHEQTNLKRQIDAADRQIDRLVYELYELTGCLLYTSDAADE